jgi:hypothetical protein
MAYLNSIFGATEIAGMKKAETGLAVPAFLFNLATTYSRGSYTATTIGKGAFDGRVRNGNGSGHPFSITKKIF